MFETSVTSEFERWFDALDTPELELVATALEMLESAGPELDGVSASRALLWYDGMLGEDWLSPLVRPAGVTHGIRGLDELTFWPREALRCLESTPFQARLLALEPPAAERALAAVERLRAKISSTRHSLAYAHEPWRARSSATLLRDAGASVKEALLEVLSFVGLEVFDVAEGLSGLRQMVLAPATPKLRIVYGVDVLERRILAILGEPLERAYYGDSVRFAERRWRDYLSKPARGLARPRSRP